MKKLTTKIKIGKNLKKVRKDKGFTQRKLSQDSNIHYSNISKIESGSKNMQVDTLERLCNSLECKSSEILPF